MPELGFGSELGFGRAGVAVSMQWLRAIMPPAGDIRRGVFVSTSDCENLPPPADVPLI